MDNRGVQLLEPKIGIVCTGVVHVKVDAISADDGRVPVVVVFSRGTVRVED
jgi:hypothetical protein